MSLKRKLRAAARVASTNVRLAFGKLAHGGRLRYSPLTCLALSDAVEISPSGSLDLSRGLRTRGRCSFNVQESGSLSFGEGVFLNSGCQFNCHSQIAVGAGCEFGSNVLVYDHDHAYRKGALKDGGFLYGDVSIGAGCWIGSGTIILRGTRLGDGCVVGAGSVLKGEYPAGSLVFQRRQTEVRDAG